MAKLLRSLARREEGQAMAEYSVLLPGAILIVITMAVIIGPALQESYCSIVGPFNPIACIVEPFQEPDGSTFCHCEQGEGEGALGLKNCHSVKYNNGHAHHEFDYWSHDGTCSGWHDKGSPALTPTPGPTSTPTPTPMNCQVLEMSGDCSQCDGHPDCVCLPGVNAGEYVSAGIKSFVIYAGKEYHVYYSGFTDDGCYYVNLDDEKVWWERYASGKDCKKISHLQNWKLILCPGPNP